MTYANNKQRLVGAFRAAEDMAEAKAQLHWEEDQGSPRSAALAKDQYEAARTHLLAVLGIHEKDLKPDPLEDPLHETLKRWLRDHAVAIRSDERTSLVDALLSTVRETEERAE